MHIARLLAPFSIALVAAAAMAADTQPRKDLPDKPGVYGSTEIPFDPIRARSESLPRIEATVEGGRSFSRDSSALLSLINEPRGILGRIELVPRSSSKGDARSIVRLFLHGQQKETVTVAPGAYILRLAFWLPDQSSAFAYPHTSDFELQNGQTATIELTRQHYDAIGAWLKAIEQQQQKNKAGKTQKQEAPQHPN